MLIILLVLWLSVNGSTGLRYSRWADYRDKIKTIEFYIYTRENKEEYMEFKIDNKSTYTNFDSIRDTQILIHDYQGNPQEMYLNKDAILEMNDCNVVMVNWSVIAKGKGRHSYLFDYIEVVGQHFKKFILILENERGLNVSKLHVIGYGAGAHIAGFTGNSLDGRIGRITGLDPLSDGFETSNSNNLTKLDKSDAACVQTVHTNRLGFDAYYIVAHGDFFPNGGVHQPGCPEALSYNDPCSHKRVLDLHLQWTKNPGMYIGFQNSKKPPAIMVEDIDGKCPKGVFYLRTSDSPPFEQIRIKPRKC